MVKSIKPYEKSMYIIKMSAQELWPATSHHVLFHEVLNSQLQVWKIIHQSTLITSSIKINDDIMDFKTKS